MNFGTTSYECFSFYTNHKQLPLIDCGSLFPDSEIYVLSYFMDMKAIELQLLRFLIRKNVRIKRRRNLKFSFRINVARGSAKSLKIS